MPPRDRSAQYTPVTKDLKKLLLTFVGLLGAIDAAIIGLYYALHIQDRPVRSQQTFVAVWVVVTLIVVTTMLKRIRVSRRARSAP